MTQIRNNSIGTPGYIPVEVGQATKTTPLVGNSISEGRKNFGIDDTSGQPGNVPKEELAARNVKLNENKEIPKTGNTTQQEVADSKETDTKTLLKQQRKLEIDNIKAKFKNNELTIRQAISQCLDTLLHYHEISKNILSTINDNVALINNESKN